MTRSLGVALVLLALPAPLHALDLTRAFAQCTGRYSALMEHQWLIGENGSEQTQQRRNLFADLMDAVLAPGEGRKALAMRIEAKFAQAALFQTRDFGPDPRLRLVAGKRAAEEIAACDLLLLRG